MRIKKIAIIAVAAMMSLLITHEAWSGNKKIMSTRASKVLAQRSLVESIHGLKIRSTETVKDMIADGFDGKTETKTSAMIKGISFEEVVYDSEKDIARTTAVVSLDSFTNIDGEVMDLKNKTFKHVGFATSTPSQAGPIKALRAAEVDAYNQLVKRVVGFTLESKTTVENYILTSDLVTTKVLATIYLAELTDYGWNEFGDAYVKMSLNIQDISVILGKKIVSDDEIIEVEGAGAQIDDYEVARLNE